MSQRELARATEELEAALTEERATLERERSQWASLAAEVFYFHLHFNY